MDKHTLEYAELLHHIRPSDFPDPHAKKKTEGKKTMPKAKRVGTNDREQYSNYISEAFGTGHLDQNEMQDRIAMIQSAKTLPELEAQVEDLPSLPELRGEKIIPKKVRRRFFGFPKLVKSHKTTATIVGFILALAWAIIPASLINSHHLGNVLPFQGLLLFSLITGVPAVVAGFIGCIWRFVCFMEDMD